MKKNCAGVAVVILSHQRVDTAIVVEVARRDEECPITSSGLSS
jgi:hypothetical protein